MRKQKIFSWVIFVVMLVIVLIYLSPLMLVIINAAKDYDEIMKDVLALPAKFSLKNFITVFKNMNYPKAFFNTAFITFFGVAGVVLLGSMAGYKMARVKTGYSKLCFLFCIMPMMIPFQSFMITLVKIAKNLGMTGHIYGLPVIYWGLGVPMAIFLYQGFCKGIPKELEECAVLDGCNQATLFFRIITPLLKSVTASVIVVNVMWMWNDFLLPLLIIGGTKDSQTLQLSAYKFMGQYKMEWQNIMASALLIILPALVIYLVFQKHIVKGMVAGAVKG